MPLRRGFLMAGLAVLLAVVLAAGGFMVLGGKAHAEPLALSFVKGHRASYRLAMSMHGGVTFRGHVEPIDTDFSAEAGWRVLSVDRQGVATVQLSTSKLQGTFNGEPLGKVPASKEKLRIGSDGRMLTLDGVPLGPTIGLVDPTSGAPFLPVLPPRPVKPRDTWTSTFDSSNAFGKGRVHYQTWSQLLRYEQLGGIEAAVVRTRFAVPIHLTIDVRKLMASMAGAKKVPRSSGHPVVSIDGSYRFGLVAWVARDTGELLEGLTTGPVKLTTKVHGVKGMPSGAAMTMTVAMKLQVTRLDLVGQARTA